MTTTLALFIAIGGTATAAATLNSTNFRDGTLTTADVKNGSLITNRLSFAARKSFRGLKGNTGLTGGRGATGLGGEPGAQGPRGSAAFMTSAYAFRDTGLTKDISLSTATPNPTDVDWDDPTYASTYGPGLQNIRAAGTYNAINLDSSWKTVLALRGMSGANEPSRSNDTSLQVTFSGGYLHATGALSLLHRNDGEDFATNDASTGTLRNGRVSCAVFYGPDGSPDGLTTMAGIPAVESSGDNGLKHELVQLSLIGNAANIAAGAGYNVAVKCRDVDYTGGTQWQVASGNLTALVSR